ncbi:hypothetical protein VARIO8X_50526 [Burkholderiales bacterium 8X]|nr:hypothetical protein VARIO8X_50526 [Burkholderiales bacterium 8X]
MRPDASTASPSYPFRTRLRSAMPPHRPCIFPAIDVLDRAQAVRNAELAFTLGADGIFFDNADNDDGLLHMVVSELKAAWPDKLVGAGYSTLGPAAALHRSLQCRLDATWTARRDVTSSQASAEALEAASMLKANPQHRLFASVALPHHPDEPHPEVAAVRAHELGMIPTTGGETGAESHRKLSSMRSAIGDAPLALAGCFGHQSPAALATLPSHLFVSTSALEGGFRYFDPDLLRSCMTRVAAAALMAQTRQPLAAALDSQTLHAPQAQERQDRPRSRPRTVRGSPYSAGQPRVRC